MPPAPRQPPPKRRAPPTSVHSAARPAPFHDSSEHGAARLCVIQKEALLAPPSSVPHCPRPLPCLHAHATSETLLHSLKIARFLRILPRPRGGRGPRPRPRPALYCRLCYGHPVLFFPSIGYFSGIKLQ